MPVPEKMLLPMLNDVIQRDRTTARRIALLEILWQERFLTREGLIARIEGKLGRGCFGDNAWEDTFYRDMRAVKTVYKAAGYELAYSRNPSRPGYYLRDHPPINPNLSQVLSGSIAEVNPVQIGIYRQLSSSERFQQGCSISDTARNVVLYRTQMRHQNLNPVGAAVNGRSG